MIKVQFLRKNILFGIIIIPFLYVLVPISFRRDSVVYGEENLTIKKNKIDWQKLQINDSSFVETNIIWKEYDELELNESPNTNYSDELITDIESKNVENYVLTKNILSSFNRSIVFNDKKVGPDISFLVPVGFRSSDIMNLDFSVRGWNRRPRNSSFFSWNNGDAVGQIYIRGYQTNKSSFGYSLGFRSLYSSNNSIAGSSTPVGEGLSAGLRWDYQLSNKSGLAIGGEQLVHFDDKTDTGRDIYLVYSKAFIKDNKLEYPFFIFTGGVGTGYLSLWDKGQFACSDLFDGAAVDENKYHPLCWGLISTGSLILNEKLSTFFEYNNYSFMVGTSYAPFGKLRLTFGATIAESYDDYKLKNFDNLRWFSRVSFGF